MLTVGLWCQGKVSVCQECKSVTVSESGASRQDERGPDLPKPGQGRSQAVLERLAELKV